MAGNNLREKINEVGLSWWTSRGLAAGWKKYAHGMVMSFPRMTTDDLRQITIGIYQIKNAASYISFHLNHKDEAFNIWMNDDFSDLLRVSLASRYQSQKIYYIYVQFQPSKR